MGQELEERLARRAFDFASDPSERLLAMAARHVADFVGVFTAGADAPEMRSYLSVLRTGAGSVGANRPFSLDEQLPARAKACFLGTAGHFHDFDDDEPSVMIGHPTVAVAAAALASLSPRHDGREFLAAYLAGVEILGRIGACVNPAHYNEGWHATASLGVFGAAVASALLRGSGPDQVAQALRFAASSSAGLKAAFGSAAKPLQVGRAAADGLDAAALAAAGLEASSGLLFGEAGWVASFGGALPSPEDIDAFADPHLFVRPGLNIKRYPCCSSSHTAVDGLLTILADEGVAAGEIERIEVWIGPDVPEILMYDLPRSGLEAKFSLRYPLAAAAISGGLSLADFETERVFDPDVASLMGRVVVHIDPDLPRAPGGVTHCSRVGVIARTGERFERFTQHPRGSAALPLGDDELRAKFVACSRSTLGEEGAAAAFAQLIGLPGGSPLADAIAASALAG